MLLGRLGELAGLSERVAVTDGLDVVLMSQDEMIKLNRQYLGHDRPTDVIAFDLRTEDATGFPESVIEDENVAADDERTVGEIIVCPQTALTACRDFDTTPEYELILYVVHGMLHIVGFNDKSEAEKNEMRRHEVAIMERATAEYKLSDIITVKAN